MDGPRGRGCRDSPSAASPARWPEDLTFRPFNETVKETLSFYNAQSEERKAQLRVGLSAEREAQVLAAWKAAQKA